MVGGLGDYLPKCEVDPNLAHYDGMNMVFRTLAAENDDIRYVSAEGLTSKDDNLHFNTESLRTFGKRYFAAFAADTELAVGTEAAFSELSGDRKLSEMKAKKSAVRYPIKSMTRSFTTISQNYKNNPVRFALERFERDF